MKNFFKVKNPYNQSEYIYSGWDLFVAGIFGAVIGGLAALVIYFEWFKEPVITTFRPLIG